MRRSGIRRVGRGCYEYARSRACRARGIWRTTRHTENRQHCRLHSSRRPADQSAFCKLNGEVARHDRNARHPRSILARMSRVSGVSTRMLRLCYEETAPVELTRMLTTSPFSLPVRRVVLRIPRARHARLVADVFATRQTIWTCRDGMKVASILVDTPNTPDFLVTCQRHILVTFATRTPRGNCSRGI